VSSAVAIEEPRVGLGTGLEAKPPVHKFRGKVMHFFRYCSMSLLNTLFKKAK